MPATQPHLPLAHYELHYLAAEDFAVGADPRGLWHGVFGLHLRDLACALPGTACQDCLLLHQCQYSYLFSGPRPPASELMRRYDSIPVPHAFRLDADFPERVRSGQTLSVGLVLVADANQRLPLVIEALAAAGQHGIGPQRGRLWLRDLWQRLPGEPEPIQIASAGRLAEARPPQAPPTPPVPAVARVEILTPYKASGQQGAKAGGFPLGPFLMALVRRVSLLQYFYTGRRLEAPFDALKEASERARPIRHDLRWQSSSRFAARHGQCLDTSGLVGRFDLEMQGIESLWPYLHLGQWLNVGKSASMGYGRYRVAGLDGAESGAESGVD